MPEKKNLLRVLIFIHTCLRNLLIEKNTIVHYKLLHFKNSVFLATSTTIFQKTLKTTATLKTSKNLHKTTEFYFSCFLLGILYYYYYYSHNKMDNVFYFCTPNSLNKNLETFLPSQTFTGQNSN